MAPFLFTAAIAAGRTIDLFNEGDLRRDFTYVDDVVEAVVRVTDRIATRNDAWSGEKPDPASSSAPYALYNVGAHAALPPRRLVSAIEQALGKKAACTCSRCSPVRQTGWARGRDRLGTGSRARGISG
jgi:UDP-glucuronate 4-epimerase